MLPLFNSDYTWKILAFLSLDLVKSYLKHFNQRFVQRENRIAAIAKDSRAHCAKHLHYFRGQDRRH